MSIFRERVAIVTGAASGIGRALGMELAGRGAHVFMADVKEEQIAEAAGQAGGLARPVALDVSDSEAFQGVVDTALGEFGRLDYLFNNAGIAVAGEVRDVSLADWRAVMEVNLFGVINGVAAAYPIMARQGFGHIVNTASIEGLIPFAMTVSYVASKHAVVGLSRALRIEARDLGVRVSAVCPGYVKTAIFTDSKMVNLDRRKILDGLPPDSRATTPEQCARVILRGVEKNKELILVTKWARAMWWLDRIHHGVVPRLMAAGLRKQRAEGIRLEIQPEEGL